MVLLYLISLKRIPDHLTECSVLVPGFMLPVVTVRRCCVLLHLNFADNTSTKCNFISLCWQWIKIIFLTLHLKWVHGVGLFCNSLPCCLYIASFIFFPRENTQTLFWEIFSRVAVQRDLRITLIVAWEASSQGYLQSLSQKATMEWKGLRIFIIWGVTEWTHTDAVYSSVPSLKSLQFL